MCGIAGLLASRPPGAPEEELVRGMLATLGHRGPDGSGMQRRGRAVLGHTRLAIIDLETGDQPMSDGTGRVQVVVNGEIYNYRELREGLEAQGHRFRTQSDIEVIPHLYRRYGDAFVEHLRGMFAMALYDEEQGRLLLVRDRLGKKPLYHAWGKDGLAFASELRALQGLPGVDGRPDAGALDLFLTYQYVPAPVSILRGVRKLPAGSMLVVDHQGTETTRRYWDPRPRPEPDLGWEEALGALDHELAEAARLRLRSDVPVGVFLSGGIDSGLVASYLAPAATEPLRAVTVGFPGAQEDERGLARVTARACGLDLREEVVDLDVTGTVDAVLDHMDEPLGDASCVPAWVVSRAAAESAKVVVSGDGGDEAFAGYADRYRQNMVLHRLRRILPRVFRRPLAGGLAALLPKGDRLPRPLRLKWVLQALALQDAQGYALDMSIVRPGLKRRLYRRAFQEALNGADATALITSAYERAGEVDHLSRLLYVDRGTYLAEGVLAKVDRMSMAHSLEVRAPLLDHRVVELAGRLPARLKLRGRKGKACLRRLAASRLPAEVVRAPKAGFAPPLRDWLRGPLRERLRQVVEDSGARVAGVLEPVRTQRMCREHLAGRRDWSRPLWLLLVLEHWARNRGVSLEL